MAPRISVFITSYNQKIFLIEAIESVLSQTLRPFELVIVDDWSSDGSQAAIDGYASRYPNLIRPYYQDRNLGIGANKGFAQRQVRGDWLTYLDGDDRFLPQKLEMEWKALQSERRLEAVFSDFYRIDVGGRRLSRWAEGGDPSSGDIFLQVFARMYPGGVLFRNELLSRRCLDTIGFYDEDCRCYEDWDLKIRLAKHFRIGYSGLALAEYRLHGGGISAVSGRAFLLRQMLRVYRKNAPLLRDVDPIERRRIENDLAVFFAKRSTTIIAEALTQGKRIRAFLYGLEFLKWVSLRTWTGMMLRDLGFGSKHR